MADKIVVMHDGRVEQIGAPLDLYDRPKNLFVAGFIGRMMNFLAGTLRANGSLYFEGSDGTRLPLGPVPTAATGGLPSMVCGRSTSASPRTAPTPRSCWSSRPAPRTRWWRLAGCEVIAAFRERHLLRPGDRVRLKFEAARPSVRRRDRTASQRLNLPGSREAGLRGILFRQNDHQGRKSMSLADPSHVGSRWYGARRRDRSPARPRWNGPMRGRRRRPGSRKRTPSCRCCGGNISCSRKTTPSSS